MIEITCDGRSMPNLSGNLLGMDCDDGKGHLVCCDIWDGLTGIALRLEMSDFVERRSNAAVIAINFCVNGRFETSFSSREHVLLKPGDMAVSRYDGIHGTETTSRLPLGYYEGLCLVIDPVQTENWLARHVPAFSIDTPHLVKILLGGGWYRYGEAGPRCEHVFRELYENISYFDTEYLQLKVIELLMLLTRMPGVSVDLSALAEKFCGKDSIYILRKHPSIEHIFSELYNVPAKIRMDYFKIKVMELLVFLRALELSEHKDERPYFYSSQIEKIKAVHELLTDDLAKNYTTEELAKQFDLSVAALKTGFKGVYGSPIYTYIRTHKMNMAASMLVTDRKKRIIEIASAVGYDNPSKFAAAFKEIFGMTPAEYRNDRR